MRYGPDYIKVTLGFDVEPHSHIPTVWRINGGGLGGFAHLEDGFRFNSVFLDVIFENSFDSTKSDEAIFVEFLHKFFSCYFHEYVHQFIPLEYLGHEKTKVVPIAEGILFNYTHTDDWASWCELFRDVWDFIPSYRVEYERRNEELRESFALARARREER